MRGRITDDGSLGEGGAHHSGGGQWDQMGPSRWMQSICQELGGGAGTAGINQVKVFPGEAAEPCRPESH